MVPFFRGWEGSTSRPHGSAGTMPSTPTSTLSVYPSSNITFQMQRPTPTSGAQTSCPGATESTYYPADFPVSLSLWPGKEKALPTTATCGRKCYEQYVKSDRVGSWEKMFSASLLGMEGWFSSRCVLTWKLKTTLSNRSYFQLAASTRPISDTAHGLLPTVTTTNSVQGFNSTNGTGKPLLPMAALMLGTPTATALVRSPVRQENRTPNQAEFAGLVASGQVGMVTGREAERIRQLQREPGFLQRMDHGLLPTPVAVDMKGGMNVPGKKYQRKSGYMATALLRDLAFSGLLPTPKAGDSSGGSQKVDGPTVTRPSGHTFSTGLRDQAFSGLLPMPNHNLDKTSGLKTEPWEKRIADNRQADLNMAIYQKTGSTSQLSPLFVQEMMGFPYLWTELPFLDGERNR